MATIRQGGVDAAFSIADRLEFMRDLPQPLQGEAARAALLRGARQMTALLRGTLGPHGRAVLVGPIAGTRPPEILDHAATIARRVYRLADRQADVGAMLIRHVAWRTFEAAGDGSATAAVLAGALLEEGMRAIAAGASPPAARRGIARAVTVAVEALASQARPIDDLGQLAGLLQGTLGDARLAREIAEAALSVGGDDGLILVEDGPGNACVVDYVEGMRFDQGWLTAALGPSDGLIQRLTEPRILVTDQPIQGVADLLPALEACAARGAGGSLVVIAPALDAAATALLRVNLDQGRLAAAAAIGLPGVGVLQAEIAQDIATATGARCLRGAAQERLHAVGAADLGGARQVWVRRHRFGIVGGRGGRAALRARVARARADLRAAAGNDWLVRRTRERIARLAGTMAVVLVGGRTEIERAGLKLRVESAAASALAALREGVVPGGGWALLDAASRVEAAAADAAPDEAVGFRVLARALREPTRAILENAGLEPGPVVDRRAALGPGWCLDVVTGRPVEAAAAGLVDPLAVVRAALVTAASAASAALGVEALVFGRPTDEPRTP